MKVFLHYEDSTNKSHHKTLKITLPKSWKNGPTSKLLDYFIEYYNDEKTGIGGKNDVPLLIGSEMHLAVRIEDTDGSSAAGSTSITSTMDKNEVQSEFKPLASDAITIETISDRQDVYLQTGPSKTVEQYQQEKEEKEKQEQELLKNTVVCAHYGCNIRFPKGGPYPDCQYHLSPPVFHETAKFWSCCPQKKAYDWETFQSIPGCQFGKCIEVREEGSGKDFLGGCDLREKASGPKLKSIDDFNNGVDGDADGDTHESATKGPLVDRLKAIMVELDIDQELFDQVYGGIQKQVSEEEPSIGENDEELQTAATAVLGKRLKDAMKTIAVEQLRIK